MKTANEKYITLKSFEHYGCIAIPYKLLEDGKLLTKVVYCKHNVQEIVITRNDI